MKQHERRNPLAEQEPSAVDALLQATGRKRRTRARKSERGRVKATWDVPRSLRDRVSEIAVEEHIPVYELVRYFLERGIEAYEAGEINFEKSPAATRYTLFPD